METMNITGNIQHESADPVSIELARGQRGSYGWTIKLRGKSDTDILTAIGEIDRILRERYGQPQEGE